MSFLEDENRYREAVGAQNLSLIRKMALGAFAKDRSVKGGIQSKWLRAAASSKYREYILKSYYNAIALHTAYHCLTL